MKISHTLTKESVSTGLSRSFAYRHPFRRIAIPLVGILCLIASAWFLLVDDSSEWLIGGLLLGAGAVYLFLPIFRRRQVVENLFAGRTSKLTLELEPDEKGITMTTSGSIGTTDWSSFVDYLICKTGILLYPQKNIFYWIPNSATIEGGTWQDFELLISKKITRKI